MTALPPRRLRPSLDKRQDTSLTTHTALSAGGAVSAARPAPDAGRKARQYQPAGDGKFIVAAQDPTSVAKVPGIWGAYQSPVYDENGTVLAYGIEGEAYPRFRMFADTGAGMYWGDSTGDPSDSHMNLWFNDTIGGLIFNSAHSAISFGDKFAVVDVVANDATDSAQGNAYLRVDGTDTRIYARAQAGQTQPLLTLADGSGDPMCTVMQDGEVEIHNPGVGIVMQSPDGTRYRATMANGGTWNIAPA